MKECDKTLSFQNAGSATLKYLSCNYNCVINIEYESLLIIIIIKEQL